jgi:outer membrane receptor protein involved in Fe transport
MNFAGWLAFNKYTMERELKPWHLPSLEAGVKGSYNLGDKIIVGLDVFYVGNRYAKLWQLDKITDTGAEFIAKERNLKGYVDASINAEYRYTKKLSAFIRINNLAAQQYMIWNNFPSQRINGMAGINCSF